MISAFIGVLLTFLFVPVFAEDIPKCVRWSPSIFSPTPNSSGQIAPDYGLYWIKYDAKSGELAARAYTTSDYQPYFSDGTRNDNPKVSVDGGNAQSAYNAVLKTQGFYDPNRPTIVFIHGWQPDKVKNQNRLDFCYSYALGNGKYSPVYNTLQYWQNWNVAVFYWTQFASEDGFVDAESKIYSATAHKGMRWAYLPFEAQEVSYCDSQDSHCLFPPKRADGQSPNVVDLAYDALVSAIPNSGDQELRIVGHSLGAQVAILLTDRLVKQNAKTIVPTQLVLLDPYFTIGNLGVLKKNVADYDDDAVSDIASHHVAISEYRSSTASQFPRGDWNDWLMNHTAYMRLYPKYFPAELSGMSLLAEEHRAGLYLYFQSNRAAPYWDHTTPANWNQSYINASASNDEVFQLMQLQRFQQDSPVHQSAEYSFPDTEKAVFNNKDTGLD